jgi:hypothetical protein
VIGSPRCFFSRNDQWVILLRGGTPFGWELICLFSAAPRGMGGCGLNRD